MNSFLPFQSIANTPIGRVTLSNTALHPVCLPYRAPRILGSYAVVYALKGMAHYQDTFKRQQNILPGDLIFIFPDVGHHYTAKQGHSWEEFYICFEGSLFDLWRESRLLTPTNPILHLEPINYWLKRLQGVVAPNLPPLERVCLLQSILAEAIVCQQKHRLSEHDQSWLLQTRHLLTENISNALYIEEVAKKMGMPHETFRKKFTRLSGTSPNQYRQTHLMERACHLVRESGLTNKEIAEKLGFSDEFHFSRNFKKQTGKSPLQYRYLLRDEPAVVSMKHGRSQSKSDV